MQKSDKENKVLEICKSIAGVSWGQSGIDWTPEKGSWRWSDLWSLLINIGCKFEKETLTQISAENREDKYAPKIEMPGEGHYALAAQMGHVSFCGAYEHLVGRKPFITKGIEYSDTRKGYNRHNGSRSQGRLVIGAMFIWQEKQVHVTSFKDDIGALIACSYLTHKISRYNYKKNIEKRFKITNEDVLKANHQGNKRKDVVNDD